MGQKVNPIGFRVGVFRDWASRWFARGNTYAHALKDDLAIRELVKKALPNAEIANVEIEMAGEVARVIIHSSRPGVVIGNKGKKIADLRRDLAKLLGRENVDVTVQEVKDPFLSAPIVAQMIAERLEKREGYKKVSKKAIADIMRAGAKGAKIRIAGRLDGAEIARDEVMRAGSMSLHTLRSDIDYALVEAMTTYGKLGIKVWICRGVYKS